MRRPYRTLNDVDQKKCATCGVWKPVGEFYQTSRTTRGGEPIYASACIPCKYTYNRAVYAQAELARKETGPDVRAREGYKRCCICGYVVPLQELTNNKCGWCRAYRTPEAPPCHMRHNHIGFEEQMKDLCKRARGHKPLFPGGAKKWPSATLIQPAW